VLWPGNEVTVWSVVLSGMMITDNVARHVPCYAIVSVLILDLKQLRHLFDYSAKNLSTISLAFVQVVTGDNNSPLSEQENHNSVANGGMIVVSGDNCQQG